MMHAMVAGNCLRGIDIEAEGLSWLEEMRCGTWWVDSEDLFLRENFPIRAEVLAASGINAVITFGCHFHWAYLKQWEEMLSMVADIVSACHKQGIKVIEHHSAAFLSVKDMKRLSFQGEPLTDWCQVDAGSGRALCDSLPDDRYTAFCPNNAHFQVAYKELAAGLISAGIDGLMSDDIQWSTPYACVCEYCREKFKRESGYSIPEIEDRSFWDNLADERYRAFLQFRMKSTGDHQVGLMEMNNNLTGKIALLACCSNTTGAWNAQTDAGTCDQFMRGNNLAFCETYISGYHFHNWGTYGAEAKVWSAIGNAYGVPSLRMFYPRSREERFFCWAMTMTMGQRYWGCSRRFFPIRGWQDEARLFDDSFIWEREHEYLFRNPISIANVAILFSTRTRDIYGGPEDAYYTDEWLGWTETLFEAGIPCDVLMDSYLSPGALNRYSLLIMPNCACLDSAETAMIKSYVRGGGNLIATFETSLFDGKGRRREDFALANVLGVSFERKITEIDIPFRSTGSEEAGRLFCDTDISVRLHSPNTLVKAREGALPLAEQEHSNVYMRYPSAVLHAWGAGRALYFSGKPGLSACLHALSRVSLPYSEGGVNWDHGPVLQPSRWIDNRSKKALDIILNSVYWLAGEKIPLRLEGAPRGLIGNAFGCGDGNGIIVHLLNATGALPEEGSLIGRDYRISYPAIKEAVRIRLNPAAGEVGEALLYSPDIEKSLSLPISSDSYGRFVMIAPEWMRRYAIVSLK